jgi:hypothetical protein
MLPSESCFYALLYAGYVALVVSLIAYLTGENTNREDMLLFETLATGLCQPLVLKLFSS